MSVIESLGNCPPNRKPIKKSKLIGVVLIGKVGNLTSIIGKLNSLKQSLKVVATIVLK